MLIKPIVILVQFNSNLLIQVHSKDKEIQLLKTTKPNCICSTQQTHQIEL